MPRSKAIILLSLATLSASAFAQNANPASPGTINYVEGSASIEGRSLTSSSVGKATLEAGQYVATADGRVEVLLTPGVFVRLGKDSTLQMVSPDLTHTEIKLTRGKADVEVDQIYHQNTILVDQERGQTQLLKQGLYAFDTSNSTLRVFSGEASAFPGSNFQTEVKPIKVKGDREFTFTGDETKPQRFNKDHAEDALYNWSSLRSQYLGEANVSLASDYAGYGGFNPGWYWAGGSYGYTWLPGDGLFWNPFGYGFYSPYYLSGGGLIYGRYGYGGGFGYRGSRAGFGGYNRGIVVNRSNGFHGGGGFHGGEGGGFHGGGGGFHGGGGGSHGGGGGHR